MADNEQIQTGDVDIVVMNFADSKIPEFKEVRHKEYVLFGEDNLYPEYLTNLYNKCGRHNAIVNSKTKYIFGGGLEKSVAAPNGFTEFVGPDGTKIPAAKVNRDGETMNEVLKKSIKDIELYGGFRWAIIYNRLARVQEIYHIPFIHLRRAKDRKGFYYAEDWSKTRVEATHYHDFNPYYWQQGVQIFAYNEYRPGCETYPLPGYVGVCNYIDTDIEISKFHLSAIKNGMLPSKMIQFYTGEPSEDKKKEIERRFKKKFAGAENGGKFILVFNSSKDKQVDVSDLSFSELDKQFELLNKTCEQQIITGHEIVSPMLFGVKTEGQLGGTTELRVAYEMFINTYAKPKQEDIEKVVNYFGNLMGRGNDYKLTQLDPIGIVFDVKDFIGSIPIQFVFEKLGIPKEYWPSQATPSPSITAQGQQAAEINENIKNLTAKQYQQLARIVREYGKGKLTREQAALLLKSGLGLGDGDIDTMLGSASATPSPTPTTVPVQMSEQVVIDEEEILGLFMEFGESKKDYHIVTSKKLKFNASEDILVDEILTEMQMAAGVELTTLEADILNLISKDKRITPEVIAETTESTVKQVKAKIASLTKRGIISTTTSKIGDDSITERTVTKKSISTSEKDKSNTTQIYIKYSYEGPKDDRNRPFCAKMMELDRLYSRAEIETISERLGYSVWDRRGGWWTKPNGEHSPTCRHRWESHIVVKKGKS
jgi:DNA-binding Lrp family transcriptional regulator